MAINSGSENSLNSSQYPDLIKSISSAQENKILLDNICNWYIFEGQIILGFNILKKYENIFKSNLKDYEVPDEYLLRPEYVSYALYNTTDLWYLLLFVNDMASVSDFTKKTIKVFDYSMIDVINNIINKETNLISSTSNPRYVSKHFLKNLNEPSKDVLGDNYYEETPFVKLPNFENKIDSLLNYNYKQSEISIQNNKITDNNGLLLNPFEISNDLYNIPSCFYKNGYNNTYKGKIFLNKDKLYNILKLYNGNINFKVFDNNENVIINLTEDFIFDNYTLIDDNRSANYDSKYIWQHNDSIGDSTDWKIAFNEKTGKYVCYFDHTVNVWDTNIIKFTLSDIENKENQDNDNTNLENLDEIIQENNEKYYLNRRIDISRIKNYDYFFIDVKYSSKYDPEKTLCNGYWVELNDYINSKTPKPIESNSFYYNTSNEMSELKLAIKNPKTKDLNSITIGFSMKDNDNAKKINIQVESVRIIPLNYEDILIPFNVNETSWYNFELSYNYKENYKGIYFEPKIIESDYEEEINLENSPQIMNYQLNENIIDVSPENPFCVPINKDWQTEKWLDLYSEDFILPNEFIISFKLNHMTTETGGSVMFIIDSFDKNSGYAFVITNTKDNDNLPNYNKDDIYSIAKPGIYKFNYKGDKYLIFENDETLSFTATLIKQLSIKIFDNYLKVVKKYNKIKVYQMIDNNWDYDNPLLDFTDRDNVFMNGNIRFRGLFAGNKTEIIEFYSYK